MAKGLVKWPRFNSILSKVIEMPEMYVNIHKYANEKLLILLLFQITGRLVNLLFSFLNVALNCMIFITVMPLETKKKKEQIIKEFLVCARMVLRSNVWSWTLQ